MHKSLQKSGSLQQLAYEVSSSAAVDAELRAFDMAAVQSSLSSLEVVAADAQQLDSFVPGAYSTAPLMGS